MIDFERHLRELRRPQPAPIDFERHLGAIRTERAPVQRKRTLAQERQAVLPPAQPQPLHPPGAVRVLSAFFERAVERPVELTARTAAWFAKGTFDALVRGATAGPQPPLSVTEARATRERSLKPLREAAAVIQTAARDPKQATEVVRQIGAEAIHAAAEAARRDPYSFGGAAAGEAVLIVGPAVAAAYRAVGGTRAAAEIMRDYGRVQEVLTAPGLEQAAAATGRAARGTLEAGQIPTSRERLLEVLRGQGARRGEAIRRAEATVAGAPARGRVPTETARAEAAAQAAEEARVAASRLEGRLRGLPRAEGGVVLEQPSVARPGLVLPGHQPPPEPPQIVLPAPRVPRRPVPSPEIGPLPATAPAAPPRLTETAPRAPELTLTPKEAPARPAGAASPLSAETLGRLPTNTSTIVGNVTPEAVTQYGSFYNLVVRRQKNQWVLTAQSEQITQPLRGFKRPDELLNAAEKILTERPSIEALQKQYRKARPTAPTKPPRDYRDIFEREPDIGGVGKVRPEERARLSRSEEVLAAQQEAHAAAEIGAWAIEELYTLAPAQRKAVQQAVTAAMVAHGRDPTTPGAMRTVGRNAYTRYLASKGEKPVHLDRKFFEELVIQQEGAQGPSVPLAQAASLQNQREAQALLREQAEGGRIRLPGPPTPPPPPPVGPAPGLSPTTQMALAVGRQAPGIRRAVRQAKQWVGERTQYEGVLLYIKNLPPGVTTTRLVNDFRLFRNRVQTLIPTRVADDLAAITQPLRPEEFGPFQDFIFLREWTEEARVAATQGRRPSIPFGISPAQVAQDLQTAQARLSPAAQAAVARHDRLTQAITADLVSRKVLRPANAREFWMRHFVLAYDELYGGTVTIPRRFREPFRQYARGRVGSILPVRTDYLDVFPRQYSRVFLDNAVDDFMADAIKRADLLPTLSQAERQALFGPSGRPDRVGQLVTVRGQPALTWQYKPGNRLYPAQTVTEDLIEQATQRALTEAEIEALAGEALALGRKHPLIVIDPTLARRLGTFNTPGKGDLFPKVNTYTQLWKRLIIDTLGLPFHTRNFTGDFENLLAIAGGPAAVAQIPYAIRVLLRRAGAQGEALLQLAREQAVVHAGLVSGNIRRAIAHDPRFLHLRPLPQRLAALPARGLEAYEAPFRTREDVLRLAKFLTNVERINRGQSIVYSGAIRGLEGLTPIQQAGRVARVAFVDYGGKSMLEQGAGELLAPFIAFFYQNTGNWMRLVARDPKRAAVPVAAYAAMVAWNHTGDRRQIEDSLPTWYRLLPHVVTGWKTGDGRHIIMSLQTASQAAAKVTGLDEAGDALIQALRGKKTPEEAALAAAKSIATGPVRFLREALGPIPRAGMTALGIDPWTGQPFVPERLRGTREEVSRRLARTAGELFPPYGALERLRRDVGVGEVPGALEIGMRTGILRAPDVGAERLRRVREAARGAEAEQEQRFFEVERAYVQSGGDPRAAIEAARRVGLRATGEQFRNRIQSPRVQAELVREQLRRTTDPAERQRLIARLQRLQRVQEVQTLRGAPRTTRQRLQELLER